MNRFSFIVCRATTLLLLFRFCVANADAEECSNCADDRNLSAEESRVLRLEFIKVQILSKLRLPAAPNVSVEPPLNVELLNDPEEEEESEDLFSIDDYFGKTREVVIVSDNSNITLLPGQRRFHFHLNSEVGSRTIKAAELWLPKVNNQQPDNSTRTYTVFDVQPLADTSISLAHVTGNSSAEWLRFDVTDSVARWAESGEWGRILEMECDGCNVSEVDGSDDRVAFLRIRVNLNDTKQRKRRDYICSDNSTSCCKEIFHVTFQEMGWNRWILKPDSYGANFCRGSCDSDISSARHFHTSVIRGFLQSRSARGHHVPTLCCAPYRMRPLTIIYMTEERHLYKKTLPNMIAESCDCV